MDFLKDSIFSWFKEMFVDLVYNNMEGMLTSLNVNSSLGELITAQPSAWKPSIWAMVTRIADTAIVPIAAGILTYAMCVELIGWINEKNNLHTTADVVTQLMKFLVKLLIGVLLVQKAQEITMGIFDLGAYLITQASGVVTEPGSTDVALGQLRETLETADIGTLMGLSITSMLGSLGLSLIGLVVRLIVTGRMIEIYIYCSCGSAPYATLTNKAISGIGANYIKNLLALSAQGFFMLLMLGIYVVLMQDALLNISGDVGLFAVSGLIFELLFIGAVLVMMLFRSKGIAKSIFSAQ